MNNEQLPSVGFLGFDVFGTVVDWRSGIARASEGFLARHGIDVDPFAFADEWRSLYEPSMQAVRSGERPWVPLRVLNRENLETVLSRHGVDFTDIRDVELADLNRGWERLDPWPDAVEGLHRLKTRFPIGPLSNGDIAGMLNLARFGSLPWDVITGAEVTKMYKPLPQAYIRSAEAVGLEPSRVGMVAAHNSDLQAAQAAGLRSVFVARPHEHGLNQTTDLTATGDYAIVAQSLTEAADMLGCDPT